MRTDIVKYRLTCAIAHYTVQNKGTSDKKVTPCNVAYLPSQSYFLKEYQITMSVGQNFLTYQRYKVVLSRIFFFPKYDFDCLINYF